jgi:hypothetical protein
VDEATLDGCIAKVRRAEKLLKSLADEWGAFLETHPYPHRVYADTEPGCYVVEFDFSIPTPPVLAVIAGEIAHDLRSALDHLVWREAVEHKGIDIAEANANRITFPLTAKCPADFETAETLEYVDADTRAILERHQPYKRRQEGGPKALAFLHWFNRMDKHRTVQPAVALAPKFFTMRQLLVSHSRSVGLREQIPLVGPGQRLKRRTKLVRLRFAPIGPDPKVRVQRTPPLSVSFGHGPRRFRGAEISQTITEVHGVIIEFTANLYPDFLP